MCGGARLPWSSVTAATLDAIQRLRTEKARVHSRLQVHGHHLQLTRTCTCTCGGGVNCAAVRQCSAHLGSVQEEHLLPRHTPPLLHPASSPGLPSPAAAATAGPCPPPAPQLGRPGKLSPATAMSTTIAAGLAAQRLHPGRPRRAQYLQAPLDASQSSQQPTRVGATSAHRSSQQRPTRPSTRHGACSQRSHGIKASFCVALMPQEWSALGQQQRSCSAARH